MEVIQGTVDNVRFSTDVKGTSQSISTRQVTVLEIKGVPVELKLSDSIVICNGDAVVMAGKLENGMFKAQAYANKTNGVSGGQDASLSYLLGSLFMFVGIVTAALIAGFVFMGIGIALLYMGNKHKKAIKLVEEMAFA